MSNTIDWGKIHYSSWSPETNLTGTASTPSFSNTYSTEYDGMDAYVLINNNANIDFTSAFSYSAWFKTTDTANTMALTSNATKFFVQLYSPTTRIRCQIFDGSAGVLNVDINASGYNDGNWHHIVFTTDALTTTNGVKVYYDGVLTSQGTLSNSGIRSSAFDWQIGKHSASSWFLNGYVDEVALFSSELSATDVTNIYNSGVPNNLNALSSPPISWWRFEGTGTTAIDSGSGGNDGVLDNTVVRSTDVPT